MRLQAAEALTRSLFFDNATIEPGDIPMPTHRTVRLLDPQRTHRVRPEAASILPLGVENPDAASDPVAATLMQFSGDDEHVRVPSPPGTGSDMSMSHSFTVGPGACANLCDRVYTVTMTAAVELESGGISTHTATTMELDCTDHGDPALCAPGASLPDGFDAPAASATGDPQLARDALDRFATEVCVCTAGLAGFDCASFRGGTDCAADVVAADATALGTQIDCAADAVDQMRQCLQTATCNDPLDFPCGLSDPTSIVSMIEAQCGPVPDAVQTDIETCFFDALGLFPPSSL